MMQRGDMIKQWKWSAEGQKIRTRKGKRKQGKKGERRKEGKTKERNGRNEVGQMRRYARHGKGENRSSKNEKDAGKGREGTRLRSLRTTFSLGAWLLVTTLRRAAAPGLLPGLAKSLGALVAAGPAGPALPGWLRVLRPLALGPTSPGGGRAVIALRRGAFPGGLCKAARAGPGAGALTSRPPSLRGPPRLRPRRDLPPAGVNRILNSGSAALAVVSIRDTTESPRTAAEATFTFCAPGWPWSPRCPSRLELGWGC
ncbi:uncharacterized protein LOC115067520 [Nannospalax galili]|uniref:uncharacterized protein LOC115067520 n=1 Tax=Nannospalax galili TaxID=1026970 RepID=UPI00111C2CC7|nr:uncharacterized protein LOC115067520 [Nannospalax galili]